MATASCSIGCTVKKRVKNHIVKLKCNQRDNHSVIPNREYFTMSTQQTANRQKSRLLDLILSGLTNQPRERQLAFLEGLLTPKQISELVKRGDVKRAIERSLTTARRVNMTDIAENNGVSEEFVERVLFAVLTEYPAASGSSTAPLCITIPKEARAYTMVVSLLAERGFFLDEKEGMIVDADREMPPIAFDRSRQGDMLALMKVAAAQACFIGSDRLGELTAKAEGRGKKPPPVRCEGMFLEDAFRFCIGLPKDIVEAKGFTLRDAIQNTKWVTSYPWTLRRRLRELGVDAVRIRYINGGVEANRAKFGADAVMDIVESGNSMREAGLIPVDPIPCSVKLISLGNAAEPARDLIKTFANCLASRQPDNECRY